MSESETQLFIIGAGGHGSELYSYASAMPNVHFAGFVDDNKPAGTEGGIHIVGGFDQMRSIVENQPATEFRYITAAGNNPARRANSTDPSVCPCRLSKPSGRAASGNT